MKNNQSVSKTVVGLLCLTGMLALAASAQASVSYNQTIPYATGTGNSTGGWTISSANGIDLSLRAQYNNTGLGAPLPSDITPNDGNGTFTFGTGNSTRAQWDFWFDVNPGNTDTTGVIYNLAVTGPNGVTITLSDIANYFHDNGVNGTEFQNAEDVGFSFLGFDPSVAGQYNIALTALDANQRELNSVDMTVNNGFAAVPEPTTVVAGALLLLPFGLSTLRTLRKNRTV